MKNRFTFIFFVMLVLVVCLREFPCYGQGLGMTQPERVGLSSERLRRIDGYMESVVEEGQISGAVVLIARRGKVAYFKTFGWMDIEANRPMEKDALFRISAFIDDSWRKVRRDEDNVVVNVATGIRIIDTKDNSLVVLADVVSHNNIGILLLGAHPEQAVTVVVAVAVLENTARAFEVRVV